MPPSRTRRAELEASVAAVIGATATRTHDLVDGPAADADEHGPTLLPDGSEAAICTNGARFMYQRYGGNVVGYHHDDNPDAALGAVEGGHDFLLVDEGRFIVDVWACDFDGRSATGVHDRHAPDEARTIAMLYGDLRRWSPVPNTPEPVRHPWWRAQLSEVSDPHHWAAQANEALAPMTTVASDFPTEVQRHAPGKPPGDPSASPARRTSPAAS